MIHLQVFKHHLKLRLEILAEVKDIVARTVTQASQESERKEGTVQHLQAIN